MHGPLVAGLAISPVRLVQRVMMIESKPFVKQLILVAALLVLPLCSFLISEQVLKARGPYWVGSNFDPDYVYLLNSLNIVNHRSPEHVDHPGTPVQALGAAVIATLTTEDTAEGMTSQVLKDPEYYLGWISRALRGLNVLACWLAGVSVLYVTRRVELGLLGQAILGFSPQVIDQLVRVSPEPLLFSISTVLGSLVILTVRDTAAMSKPWLVAVLAILSGLGLASKFTFAPILLIPLLFLTSHAARLMYLLGALGSAVAFTSPILSQYHKMFEWLWRLGLQTGQYGTGEATIIDRATFLTNVRDVLLFEPVFSGLVAVGMTVYFVSRRHEGVHPDHKMKVMSRVLGAVLIAQVVQILLVAKHPWYSRYLIPAFG